MQDALAAARLTWKLARRYPGKIGSKPLDRLHEDQQNWGWRQTARDAGLRSTGYQSADHPWPLRPCTWTNPQWDEGVIEAIHREILGNWERKLRDGPGTFRTELHIVNDTRDPRWYYSSVRAMPMRLGYDDTTFIIAMGFFAAAKAADRVVIAWEPSALRASTANFDPQAKDERALKILDAVVGLPVRLSTHPYTQPVPPPGARRFSWGKATMTDHPTELPPVIAAIIETWRLGEPGPQSESSRIRSFRKIEFDIWDTPRPR